MVLSTNAKAVTDAIGQFSESQIVADSLTNLLNRRDLLDAQRASARLGPEIDKANAVTAELQQLFAKVGTAPTAAAAEESYVRILNAIAAALGSTQSFTTIKEAEAWFRGLAVNERGR